MAFTLSLTQSQSLAALRTALLSILPSGIEIVQGEDNRVAEPAEPDFVVMTPILRTRLETNINSYQDAAFTGSVSGAVLTVSLVAQGSINSASRPTLFGPTVLPGTQITSQISGDPGGAGAYALSQAQTIASGPLAAGVLAMMQPTQLTVQIDVHGPGSADNVQAISTVLRSAYGCGLFSATGYDVTPLYASDPRQTPWLNAEQQIERMWNCDAVLQVNSIVFIPQQFFSALSVVVEPPVDAQAGPAPPISPIPPGSLLWNGASLVWNDGFIVWTQFGTSPPSVPAGSLLWNGANLVWNGGFLVWA